MHPGEDAPFILMYHRVRTPECDPWHLAVTPDHLAEQLDALLSERVVVPLDWLAGQLRSGFVPRGVAVLTFDDGYAEMLTHTKPLLERLGCPATMFLVTGALGDPRGYWWDRLARVILDTGRLPDRLEFELGGEHHAWQLDPRNGGALAAGNRATALEVYFKLWEMLKPQRPELREERIEDLARWAGATNAGRPADRVLTREEAARLCAPGFIDIGAHGVNHASLPSLPDAEKRSQIADSRSACETITGRSVRAFSYPFGDLDDASVLAARQSGVSMACTTAPARVSRAADLLRLPRINVLDWDADAFGRNVLGRGGKGER